MAIVKINTTPPKKVIVRGLFQRQPTTIDEIAGLRDALDEIIASYYTKEVIDEDKIFPILQALALKAGLTDNTFEGTQIIENGNQVTLSSGAVNPMNVQNVLGVNKFLFNCYMFQDPDTGQFFYRQVDDGKSAVLTIDANQLTYAVTSEEANAGSTVAPEIAFEIQADGVPQHIRRELVLSQQEEFQIQSHKYCLILLDGTANSVNYYLDPALWRGVTLEVLCLNSDNDCVLVIQDGSNKYHAKNDPTTGINFINMYASESKRLFYNGSIIREI